MPDASDTSPKSDKLRCSECGEKHSDWEKVGGPYAPSPDAWGRLQPIECGKCGETMEVGVP